MSRLHSYAESEVNFYYVDENAKKANPSNVDTFNKLISHLQKPTQNCRYPQLYLVRGILVWIAQNQSYAGPDARYTTPLGFIQQLVRRRLSPAEVFTTFCGYAGIECEEVTGRAKAIRYRAGDGESEYFNHHTWIAFKADGKWHLMHPLWSIHAYVGYEHGGEIELEKDGRDSMRRKVETQGTSIFLVNDFWFCISPEICVTRCFPDQSKWQNPDGSRIMSSFEEFLALPDLRQGFYDMKLFLLSKHGCILQSVNGKCYISIMAEKDMANCLDFSYELAMEGTSGDNLNVTDMQQLVLPQFCGNIFKFEIRLPVVGTYWFRLAVGLVNEPDTMRNCCEFKISCKEVNKNCQRFPACSGLGMYGHGYQAIDAGLLNSSEVSAKINMKPNYEKSNRKKQTVAKFKTDDDPSRDMMYGAEMHSNGSDSVDEDRIDNVLIGNTEVVHDKTRGQLVVNASIPKDGEYAVVITARDKKDKSQKKATPVVGYMVTTQIDNDYNTNEALINQRQKEIRSENNRKIKMEQRSILTALMDETNAQIDSLSVSGRRK